MHPWKQGSFSIPTDGLWRFSFNAGYVAFPSSSGYGAIYLKVDGTTVAESYTNPTDDGTGMVKKMETKFVWSHVTTFRLAAS